MREMSRLLGPDRNAPIEMKDISQCPISRYWTTYIHDRFKVEGRAIPEHKLSSMAARQ